MPGPEIIPSVSAEWPILSRLVSIRCNSMILYGKRKSFVDDLSKEQGIVSMRVALCYDLLRFILGSIRFVQLVEISYLLLYGDVQL